MRIIRISVAVLALAGITNAAIAATPGLYVSGGLGYSNVEQKTKTGIYGVKKSTQDSGAAGRVAVGYNLNNYYGIEGGYNYLGQVTAKNKSNIANLTLDKISTQLQSGDLVGKIYLPIYNSGFNAYALGGAAYVHADVHDSGIHADKSTTSKVLPKYGVGVSYDIPNSPVTTAIEASRVQSSNHNIPSFDTALVTLSYSFGQ